MYRRITVVITNFGRTPASVTDAMSKPLLCLLAQALAALRT